MPSNSWHLDKGIPLAFLFAIIMQTIVAVWYVSGVVRDVESNQDNISRLQASVKEIERRREEVLDRVSRIEEKLSFQTQLLQEIRKAVIEKR